MGHESRHPPSRLRALQLPFEPSPDPDAPTRSAAQDRPATTRAPSRSNAVAPSRHREILVARLAAYVGKPACAGGNPAACAAGAPWGGVRGERAAVCAPYDLAPPRVR